MKSSLTHWSPLLAGLIAIVAAGCAERPQSALVLYPPQENKSFAGKLLKPEAQLTAGNGIYVGDGMVWTVGHTLWVTGHKIAVTTYGGERVQSLVVAQGETDTGLIKLDDPADLQPLSPCSKPPVVGEKVFSVDQVSLGYAGAVETVLDSRFFIDRVLAPEQAGGAIVPESRSCFYGITVNFEIKAISDGHEAAVGRTEVARPSAYFDMIDWVNRSGLRKVSAPVPGS